MCVCAGAPTRARVCVELSILSGLPLTEIQRYVNGLHFSAISKHYSQINLILNNTGEYKLVTVCEVEILQVTVNTIEVLSSF